MRAHPGDVFGAADAFVEGVLEPQRAAKRAIGIRKQRSTIEQRGVSLSTPSGACRSAPGTSRSSAATGGRRRQRRARRAKGSISCAQPVGTGGQRVRAQGGDDLGVDVGDAQVQRVAVGELVGRDLDQRASGNERTMSCVPSVEPESTTTTWRGRQGLGVEDGRERLADEARLVLGADDDRHARGCAQDDPPSTWSPPSRDSTYFSQTRWLEYAGACQHGLRSQAAGHRFGRVHG